MKILTAAQINKIDKETILEEGISSFELMKRAARAFYNLFIEKYPDRDSSLLIFAGTANNGGDGLLIGGLLHKLGYSVKIYLLQYGKHCSKDCAESMQYLKNEGVPFEILLNEEDIPDIDKFDVVIDGIFGTGLSRPIIGLVATAIECINKSKTVVISIDLPTGLFLDRKTTFAVEATETVTFQIPKLALYLPENQHYVGNVTIVDIGLNRDAIAKAETNIFFTEKSEIRSLLKPLSKFAHKGTEGHALIIGGAVGKMGAICLAAKAALKTGCGLVTAYLPKSGVPVIQAFFPEAMAEGDIGEEHIVSISYDIDPDSIGIGVGMGKNRETREALYHFLQTNRKPLVIDADALNILAENPEWLSLLPDKTVLTPHPGELLRLIGEWEDDFDKINKTISFSKKYGLIVLIKGAYSLIIDSENVFMNGIAAPALATAGSGDVLTGMIAALLAQNYSPLDAVRVGVFLHAMTAVVNEHDTHRRSFIATNIIENISAAYKYLE